MKKITTLTKKKYPPQFWVLFWGMLISTTGAGMIWPFLMIYVSEKLALPLTSIAVLMTMHAAAGLVSSFFVGTLTDKAGRKITMSIGLVASGLLYLAMVPASTYTAFAVIMILRGIFNPLYRIGSRAMIADLVPEDERADAYALSRLGNNVGIALGPAIGGFVATSSYTIAFICATVGLIAFGLVVWFFTKETLPEGEPEKTEDSGMGSYKKIFADKPFIFFALAFTLTQIAATTMWILMAVYAKNNFGVPENQYGFIAMTNALMVVTLQLFVTRVSKKYQPILVMALGAFIYAAGVTSIALATGFWGFWISMVVVTWGELLLVPTATTYVANTAPSDMRGRYMGIFTLGWGIATGIGPIVGGFLNDNISPVSIWYGGGLIGLFGALMYLNQYRKRKKTA